MSLAPGSKIGPYVVKGTLGAGGMGEVYLARDERLERDVAVKVLPASLAADELALARFEREARAVAALAHPNIVAIYDLGSDGERAYAAMEYLEGETLRERLASGAVPVRKATMLARQIARGLGAAHDRGIVHRDLKPENIFISKDGQAKILDFGLAAERDATGSGDAESVSLTRTSLTAPGSVMGTVGYMAPEQVRGEPVDHRADIFSFGSVLHEMLSGRRAFDRDTAAETMTAILREEPGPIGSASGELSPALERVVERCLEKNRDERFQSARDLAFAIDTSISGSGGQPSSAVTQAVRDRSSPVRVWGIAAAALALGTILGFAVRAKQEPAASIEPPRVRALTTSGHDVEPSASPDGRLVAFQSRRDGTPRIWIRQIEGGGEQPVTDGPDIAPRFSPDGSTLLFLRDEGPLMSIYSQPLVGGRAKKLVHDAIDAAWSPDGSRIAFFRSESSEGSGNGVVGVADAQAGGGEIVARSSRLLTGLSWTPDGKSLLAIEASVTGNIPDTTLVRIDVADGTIEALGQIAGGLPLSSPRVLASGEVVLAVAGSLVGDHGDPLGRVVRFDPATGEVRTLFWAAHLFPLQGMRAGFSSLDILEAGTIVFHRTVARQSLRRFDLDRPGSDPTTLTRGESLDRQPAYSSDGRHLVFSSNRSGNLDLWRLEIATGTLRQLTDDAAQDWDPAFTPDGKRVLWSSDRSGHLEIWIANADGSAPAKLTDDGADAENPTVTADGEWVIYWSSNAQKAGIWKIRIDGRDATQLVAGRYMQPELSPDGRYASYLHLATDELTNWIHVVDVESGKSIPFRVAVPAPIRAENIILGRMRWLPDGSALAFVGIDEASRTGVFVQDFAVDADTSATRRKLVGFSPDYVTESFGIAPDGRSVTIGAIEQTQQLMLAEGLPGIAPPP